ncbi:MAG: DNA-3-methyladenine glycosylase family protein [Actinomycetota bacterium]
MSSFDVPLEGPAGEPVDLARTLVSHGTASLAPMLLDEEAVTLEVTVPVRGARPRTILIRRGDPGLARIEVRGRAPSEPALASVRETVSRMLNLDEDLSEFYAAAAEDPDLAWVTAGAGRMVHAPTVFEDVVKTVCTTNCSWSLTTKMVTALVGHLGEPTAGAPGDGWHGRAFPTPSAMAEAEASFYRDVARAGYRGPYLRSLAGSVAEGEVDLEALRDHDLPDEEVEARLLTLPGLGPYAAAHVMLTLGRYGRLVLDSWTRPTYARLRGSRRPVSDGGILRRFRRFGPHAGLAFWCYLTRDWVDD